MRRHGFLPCCLAGLLVAGTTAVAAEPGAAPSIGGPASDTSAPATRWSASSGPEVGGYRWSWSRGAVDVGLRFESRPEAPRSLDARFDSAAPAGSTLPTISLGLSNVSAGRAPAPASSLVERALGSERAVPYVSRVGVEWKPAQSQVFLNHGLGFRLGSDDRITMRLRKGSLGIYMKRNF